MTIRKVNKCLVTAGERYLHGAELIPSAFHGCQQTDRMVSLQQVGTRYYINSKERHESRYLRRRKKREEKRKLYLKKYDDIELVANIDNLRKSSRLCSRGVMWKASTQKYRINEFYNITGTRKKILEGKDLRKGFICFQICERGKKRDIKSVHIQERVPQKSLCRNVLTPALRHNLIYDNGACLKGKGVTFAQDRCAKHLRDHYRKYGTSGYVLTFDFHHYFDSIPHYILKNRINNMFNDRLIKLHTNRFIDAFGDRGLGLGSEICQILAVSYPNPMDHMIKDCYGIHGYGRYNDDGYIISSSKEQLKSILSDLKLMANKLGLELNEKKTQIVKLTKGFRFLKIRYVLKETGKVLKLPWRRSITKQRQKLKKFQKLVAKGLMTMEQVSKGFISWLGYMKRKNTYKTVQSMKNLFYNLFGRKDCEKC